MANEKTILNPFPGIRSFEGEEDYLFFGRESQVSELIKNLAESHFVAVIGSSGCGKSSLVKAGVIPSLFKNVVVKFDEPWSLSLFRPGKDPIDNLANSLFESQIESGVSVFNSKNEIVEILKANENGLSIIISKYNDVKLFNRLIIVDQFEELFRFKQTNVNHSDEDIHFVKLVLEASQNKKNHTYILLTMRSDFLDYCAEFPGLVESINDGHYLVPRMTKDEIKKAIVGPVNVFNAIISDDLIDKLLMDVGSNPDQLPILQHALMRTWDYWKVHSKEGDEIKVSDYEAIGGMEEALSQHAEEIFAELETTDKKEIAEKLFKALTELNTENKGTRRPCALSEICELANANEIKVISVINSFRQQGRAFLMPSYKEAINSDSIIDISHESIMRVWFRLKKWVEEETESAKLYLRLANSSMLYQEGKSGLLVNPELELAVKWKEESHPNKTWALRYDPAFERALEFLNYSYKQYQIELKTIEDRQKRELKRARFFAIVLGAASIISILFLIVSLNLRIQAQASEKKALNKEKLSQDARNKAESQRKEAILQKKISEQQQQITEEQRLLTEDQKRLAVEQQLVAENQKRIAIQEKNKASRQEALALEQKKLAEEQKEYALSQKKIAETEKQKAEVSEKNALRLRKLAVARSVAIQASELSATVEGDLPSLLAYQAYLINVENGGNPNQPEIYNALIDVEKNLTVFRDHKSSVKALAYDNSSGKIAACTEDGTIEVLSKNSTKPLKLKSTSILNTSYRAIDIINGKIVAGKVSEIDYWTDENDVPKKYKIDGIVLSVEFVSDEGKFLASTNNGLIYYIDPNNEIQNPAPFKAGAPILDVLKVGGDEVYFALANGNIIKKSLAKLSETEVVYNGTIPIYSLEIQETKGLILAGDESGKILLIDKNNGEKINEFIGHSSRVSGLCFGKDHQLISSSFDGTVRVWNFEKPEQQPIIIDKHDGWVLDVVYDDKNDNVVSCSADKSIRFFPLSATQMADQKCDEVKRNLTLAEWNKYIGEGIEYQKSCSKIQ